MTTSHTPGPWRVFGAQAENGTSNEIHACNKMVARVFMNSEPLEREANARLIAAAPDLLEALKDLLDLVEVITPMEGDTVRKARAAIAKVTGEHP